MKIRCLIVDDEPPAIEVLKSHISATPLLEVVGECPHAMAAFDFLQKHPVDLLFLDIHMPKLSGTQLLKSLAQPPKVIFTTAHREFAVDGFDFNAVDFLLKPISLERFLKAVQKAIHPNVIPLADTSGVDATRFLYFRSDRRMVKVPLSEITYIESLKDYVQVSGPSTPVVTKQTITAIQEMLPSHAFIRVHRSFVVAVSKVTSYTSHSLFLGNHEIPVGPLYRNEVARRLEIR
jgi:DNA-binding LytR/AlgR family response regulator